MNLASTAIVVFMKKPVAGFAKTRLSKKYGKRGAARVARRLAEHQLRQLAGVAGADIILSCAPDTSHPFFHRLQKQYSCKSVRQSNGDLGRRMFITARDFLKHYQRVLVIGTDCPDLDGDIINQAIAGLEQGRDVMLGPSADGGYYLLGLAKVDYGLFAGVRWGTSSVLAQTRCRLQRLGYRYALLDELEDVDTAEDVRNLKRRRPLFRHDWQV